MPSILCIDDDPNVLELRKSVLGRSGYTVLTALDGPTGIELAHTNRCDMIVLDFKMPGMDGSQVAELLMQEHPNLPVIVCSGFPYEVPEPLKWLGAAFVEKSESPSALLSAIQQLFIKKALSPQPSERRWAIDKSHRDAA